MIKFKCMKKSIEISLDKAREWYKRGGELAEIALTAFLSSSSNVLFLR